MKLDTFTQQYIETALWSTNDESDEYGGERLDQNYSIADIDEKTLAKMVEDCQQFQKEHWDHIASDLSRAGHDFWLTRNGHGTGFWDGDWQEEVGQELTAASKKYGEFNLYVGDDGKIYS